MCFYNFTFSFFPDNDGDCLNIGGDCKVIEQCQPLYALLQKKPLTTANANLLRKYHCGFEGSSPKVCCQEPPQPHHDIPDEDSSSRYLVRLWRNCNILSI